MMSGWIQWACVGREEICCMRTKIHIQVFSSYWFKVQEKLILAVNMIAYVIVMCFL